MCNKYIVSDYLLSNAVLDMGAISAVNYHIMWQQDTQCFTLKLFGVFTQRVVVLFDNDKDYSNKTKCTRIQ